MTVTKTNIGTNEDGSLRYHFHSDKAMVYTGVDIRGTVTLDSGKVVDVSDHYSEVEDEDEAAELAHKVALRYLAEGHPTDPGFAYAGPEARSRIVSGDDTEEPAPAPAAPVVAEAPAASAPEGTV